MRPILAWYRIQIDRHIPVLRVGPGVGRAHHNVSPELPLAPQPPAVLMSPPGGVVAERVAAPGLGIDTQLSISRVIEACPIGADREWIGQRRDAVLRIAYQPVLAVIAFHRRRGGAIEASRIRSVVGYVKRVVELAAPAADHAPLAELPGERKSRHHHPLALECGSSNTINTRELDH